VRNLFDDYCFGHFVQLPVLIGCQHNLLADHLCRLIGDKVTFFHGLAERLSSEWLVLATGTADIHTALFVPAWKFPDEHSTQADANGLAYLPGMQSEQ
jgi:hypothetical protein